MHAHTHMLARTFSKTPLEEGSVRRRDCTCQHTQHSQETYIHPWTQIPVEAQSKAWVCGRSLAGIAGSNAVACMDVCLLWVLCIVRYRSLRRADSSSRRVLPSVVCLSIISNSEPWRGLHQLGLSSHKQYAQLVCWCMQCFSSYTSLCNYFKLLDNDPRRAETCSRLITDH